MSRDSIGDEERSPWRAPLPGTPSTPPEPAGPPPSTPGRPPAWSAAAPADDGTAVLEAGAADDLDARPGTSTGTAPRARGGRARALLEPAGRRAVALVLVGVLVGTAGSLLAVRARDADRVTLASGGAFGSGFASTGDGDPQLQAQVLLVNAGDRDVELVGMGIGRGDARVEGTVLSVGDTFGLPAEAEDEQSVVPAGGSALVTVAVPGSCEDPPVWEPWVRARGEGGRDVVVDLRAETDGFVGGGGPDLLVASCADSFATTTPSVVGATATDEGLAVEVQNLTDAAYTVVVPLTGPLGLSVDPQAEGVTEDGGVLVPSGQTVPVPLLVAPPDCATALGLDQPSMSVLLRAERVGEDGEGPGTADLPPDSWFYGERLGVALGRACPQATAEGGAEGR